MTLEARSGSITQKLPLEAKTAKFAKFGKFLANLATSGNLFADGANRDMVWPHHKEIAIYGKFSTNIAFDGIRIA